MLLSIERRGKRSIGPDLARSPIHSGSLRDPVPHGTVFVARDAVKREGGGLTSVEWRDLVSRASPGESQAPDHHGWFGASQLRGHEKSPRCWPGLDPRCWPVKSPSLGYLAVSTPTGSDLYFVTVASPCSGHRPRRRFPQGRNRRCRGGRLLSWLRQAARTKPANKNLGS
jgi:hypothetical protein